MCACVLHWLFDLKSVTLLDMPPLVSSLSLYSLKPTALLPPCHKHSQKPAQRIFLYLLITRLKWLAHILFIHSTSRIQYISNVNLLTLCDPCCYNRLSPLLWLHITPFYRPSRWSWRSSTQNSSSMSFVAASHVHHTLFRLLNKNTQQWRRWRPRDLNSLKGTILYNNKNRKGGPQFLSMSTYVNYWQLLPLYYCRYVKVQSNASIFSAR